MKIPDSTTGVQSAPPGNGRRAPRRVVAASILVCLSFLPPILRAQDNNQLLDIAQQVLDLLTRGTKQEQAGDYDGALVSLQHAVDLAEKNLAPNDPLIGMSLDTLGSAYIDKGEYKHAEDVLRRAVKNLEKAAAYMRPSYAKALHDLGVTYDFLGDYSRAEPLYEQALAIREALFGPTHLLVAQSLNFLGNVYLEKADYALAEQTFQRALAIFQKLYGPEHWTVVEVLNNLASVYEAQGDHAKAEDLFKRAITISEKAMGPESIQVALYLNNLGSLYRTQDTAKARALLDRALAIREKVLGPNHPDVARTLNNLAMVDWQDGNLKQAEQRLLRGLGIFQRVFGPGNPNVSTVLANLAMLYAVHGNAKRAISVLTDGSDARDRNLQLTLATGSEEQKRLYMASIADGTSTIVSLHLRFAANDVEAAHLALTTILRRKGRVLDVMSGQIAALGNHRDIVSEAVLTKLAGVRGQLSSLVLRGPGDDAALYSTTMEGLQAQIQALEKTVSERATASEASAPLVSIEGVQAAIPVNAALVELIQYRPLLSNRSSVPHWDVPRYAAYVLKHSGPPAWVDLGDAVRIDLAAMHFLTALRTHASLISSARTLDDEVMRPVRKLLGNVRQVLISPDGELNLVPFAALIDERNQYLVENYTLTYLTSGRDLLRLGTHLPSRQGPVVIANPLFETPARDTPLLSELERNSARDTGRSADFGERFMPLQETSEEAREVSSILTGAKVYTGAQATEALVKQLTAPSILHIATHGFFLGKPVVRNAASTGAGRGSNLSAHSLLAENPLLRSGIALSGANELNDGQGQDGVLTALEAAGLDLHGTKLVVLSACETGVGDVQTGEGVYGLRRALVLAGAESEIISLWKVDDDATRDLMVEFYKKLQSGISRAEALRQVQLKLLKSADHNQPFFWAPFILSGDWGTLAAAP